MKYLVNFIKNKLCLTDNFHLNFALKYACQYGHLDIAQYLLTDISITDKPNAFLIKEKDCANNVKEWMMQYQKALKENKALKKMNCNNLNHKSKIIL